MVKKPLRKRILGIKRKTLAEVKTLVLEQMAREEPTIQREMNRNITRAIFVEKNSVTVLRPRELQYKYYEMNDLQFNLFSARVKEETENDRLKVTKEKEAILEQMNRIQEARGSSDIMI
jgi:inorganic pyrophosphatase/exopolyphosphatase